MHAPLSMPRSTTTSSGFEDGLGRRVLAFDRVDGGTLERLYLRAEFGAFETAIAELSGRVAAATDDRIIAPLGVERDEHTGEVVVVTSFAGERLSDLIDASTYVYSDEISAPGIDVALGFLIEALATLDALGAETGLSHGLLVPSRIVFSPNGRIGVTECVFAPILQRLNLSRRRLWTDFGVVTPPAAGAARFDATADIAQAAVTALVLALGRPVEDAEAPDLLPDLMSEMIEIAQIRGTVSFAIGLQRFLQRALPLAGRRPYLRVDAALADAREVASAIGIDGCLAALSAFGGQGAPEVAQEIEQNAAPVIEEMTARVVEERAAPMVEEAPEPAVVSPRRRRSARRSPDGDTLRSVVVTVPEPVVTPPAATIVEPIPFAAAPPPPRPPDPPVVSVVAALPAIRVLPPPPLIPQPVFAPAPVFPSAPVAAAPLSAYVAPRVLPTPSSLRVKSEPPSGYAPPPKRYTVLPDVQPAPRRVSWQYVAAPATVILVLVAATRTYLPERTTHASERGPVARTVPPAAGAAHGIIEAQSQPAGARVLLDGDAVGDTPVRIADVAPGRHTLTFITPTATVTRTVRIEAGKTLAVDVPVFSGWVAVFAPIVLEISEKGQSFGTTEQGRVLLPPGRHTLTLVNRDLGYKADHVVDIEAGEVRSLNVDPRGTVSVNALPWAEVWVDGRKAGDTPLANLQLPLGNREIVFRHPEHGERRIMTMVTASAPRAVSIDFTKPQ